MADDSAVAQQTAEQTADEAAAAKRARTEQIGRYAAMFIMPLFLVGMMMWGYIGSQHSPSPRDMPIAVAGAQGQSFAGVLDKALAKQVDTRLVGTADEAKQLVIDREVTGAVVVEGDTATLYTASAAGVSQSQAVTSLVTPVAAAQGTTLQTEDLRPTAKRDSAGVAAMFMTTATVLAGYLPLSIILSNSPQLLFLRRFVPLLAAWGALIAVVIWLVVGPILDVLPSDKAWHALGIIWLGVVAIGTVQLFFTRLIGPMAVLLAMLLLMVLGMPSSNMAISMYMVNPFFKFLHSFLPMPAIGEALRAVLYFDGDGAGKHVLVLAIGGALGLLLTFLADLAKTHRTPHPEPVKVNMPSLHGGARPQSRFWRYAALLFFPLAMVTMMITMMLGSMHSPTPKDMPVAVVTANQQQGQAMISGIDAQMPGMFDFRLLEDAAQARQQVHGRDIVGAFVLPGADDPKATIVTAPAASNSAAQSVERVFTMVASAQNIQVDVDRIVPLPNRDSMGTVTMYVAMGWMLAGFMVIIVGANAAPASRPLHKLLPIVAVYSGFMSAVILLIAGPITGALAGVGWWQLWQTGMIAIFCVAMFATVFERLFGMLAILPVIGVVMFLGVPASNGAMSVYMIPSFFRGLNDVLPMAAAVDAARSIVYFDSDTLGVAILTLVAWGVVSLLVVAIIDHFKPVRTEIEEVTAPDPAVLTLLRDKLINSGRWPEPEPESEPARS